MARPEKEIPAPDRPLGLLAQELRTAKKRKGLTYEKLEVVTGVSIATLSRAASGRALPTLKTAVAYYKACDGTEDIRTMWEHARRQVQGAKVRIRVPRLDLVRNRADFSDALLKAYEEGPAENLRDLVRRAEARAFTYGPLSRSTAQRILSLQQFPTSCRQLRAVLFACGVPAESHSRWESAWQRAENQYQREIARSVAIEDFVEVESRVAVAEMRAISFEPLEGYRGRQRPWSARCRSCRAVVRVRAVDVMQGKATCVVCRRNTRHVNLPGEYFYD